MKLNPKHIVIVEDEPIATKYLQTILKKLGFTHLYHATNCLDASRIIHEHDIELIFMDINIKGQMDGIRCAQAIEHYPVIYTTVYKDPETIKDAYGENVYGYLTKPFDLHDVYIALLQYEKTIDQRLIRGLYPHGFVADPLNADIYDFGRGRVFHFATSLLTHNGEVIGLSERETQLLIFFCQHSHQYLSYEILRTNIWKREISDSTIRDTIYRLKQKFPGELPLQNVYGLGYCLSK